MRIELDLPSDLDWITETLTEKLEIAQGSFREDTDPLYASGRLSMIREVIEELEVKVAAKQREMEDKFGGRVNA